MTLLNTRFGRRARSRVLRICDEFCTVWGVAFSHDGSRLAVAADGGIAGVWSVATRHRIQSFQYNTVPVSTAVFSPHDRRVLTASQDGTARLWDVKSGRRLALFATTGSLLGAGFSPDGKAVVTASDTGRVSVWDLSTRHVLTDLAAHAGPAYSAAFSPHGARVLTASEDGAARIWDASPRELRRIGAVNTAFLRVAKSAGDGRIITGGEDGAVRVWNIRTGHQRRVLDVHPRSVADVAMSLGGLVWAVDSARVAHSWDARTAKHRRLGTKEAQVVALSRDGKHGAVGDFYGTVTLRDLRTGKQVSLETRNWVHDLEFSPSGTRLAVASGDGNVRIIDSNGRGKPVAIRISKNALPDTAAFSPDEKAIVTTATDGSVAIWSLARGRKKPLATFSVGNATATTASFSPDGRRLVTSSEDGAARIWDVETRKELTSFTVSSGINTASFTPDGSGVVTAGNDGKLRVWSTELAAPLPTIERIAGQRLTRGLTPAERATYLAGISG